MQDKSNIENGNCRKYLGRIYRRGIEINKKRMTNGGWKKEDHEKTLLRKGKRNFSARHCDRRHNATIEEPKTDEKMETQDKRNIEDGKKLRRIYQ